MTAARKPRALRRGDLVGVAAPAGPVDAERLGRGVAELERLGFAVRVADGVLERTGFTAGSVENRLGQLHGLFADPAVAGIACARGGAGAIQLMPGLDRDLLEANPKPLLGYSDITLLHLEMERLGLTSLHGPMVARELADGDTAYDLPSLWHALTGEGEPYASGPDDLVVLAQGRGEGVLRGGCLSLLAAAAGTALGPAQRGRAHHPLRRGRGREALPGRSDVAAAAGLGRAAGGERSGLRGHEGLRPGLPRGLRARGGPARGARGLDVPVALGLSSGHTAHPNLTLPFGVRARLECAGGEARFAVLEAPVE